MIRPAAVIILAIERECLVADRAIDELRWPECEASWALQAKLEHELVLALDGVPRGDATFAPVRQKIDRIVRYRDGQIKRLRALNAEISARLSNIEQFRTFSRTISTERVSSLLDVTT